MGRQHDQKFCLSRFFSHSDPPIGSRRRRVFPVVCSFFAGLDRRVADTTALSEALSSDSSLRTRSIFSCDEILIRKGGGCGFAGSSV